MLQVLNLDNVPMVSYELKSFADSQAGTVFTLTHIQAENVYSVYRNQIRLNRFFDYSVQAGSVTLAEPISPGDSVIIIPKNGLRFFTATDNAHVVSGKLKRDNENIYDACFLFSKDRSVLQKDFTQDAEFLNGVGSGFSNLTPSALIGMAVIHAYGFRGFVIENTETTITLDTDYSMQALLPTELYSIGNLEFSTDLTEEKVYSRVVSLPPFLDDTEVQFFARRTGLLTYKNETLTTVVVIGDEF